MTQTFDIKAAIAGATCTDTTGDIWVYHGPNSDSESYPNLFKRLYDDEIRVFNDHGQHRHLVELNLSLVCEPEASPSTLKYTSSAKFIWRRMGHNASYNKAIIATGATEVTTTDIVNRLNRSELFDGMLAALEACVRSFEQNRTGGFNGDGKTHEVGSPYLKAIAEIEKAKKL